MKAWQVTRLGAPVDALRLVELDDPAPGPGQLLVRVGGAALSYPDALLCRGEYQVKPEPPFTLGVEAAGEVVAVGEGVTDFVVGQRVLGMTASGGLAELALFEAAHAFPSPDALDDAEAAALHMNHQTAHFALHHRAGLRRGETVLVHAGAGGVGSATIQLGKAAGATVIAVVGGPAKAAVARDLGADVVVDRLTDDFVAVVKEHTAGRGADIVVDPVGGDTFARSTKCVAFEGRIVIVGFTSGEFGALATNHALIKNYSVVGLHWGMYRFRDPALVREVQDALDELVAAGSLRPLVSERLAMADAPEGITRLYEGRTVGRVVVSPAH
ncbi:MAG TPA: NADPH:quinone oxidoreductase family protein [Pseudonocardiaceae bacterium]